MQRGLWLALALAPACGQSTHHDHAATVADGGVGGESSGGAPESGGGASAGSLAQAGSSSGGVSTAGGAQETAGEPSVGGGAAGEGGVSATAGGGAGGEPLSPNCDDGNPCTLDTFSAASCHHDPEPDNQLCDDGNFCTLGDKCLAGVCVPGSLQTGAGQALGTVETYGTGLAISVGDEHFAFVGAEATPAHLTLASVVAGALERDDQVDVDASVGFSFIGTGWDDLIALADGDSSFGLNGPSRYLQLFSVESDGSLTPHTAVPITPGSQTTPANTSMTGRGSRLFLCHNWAFFGAASGTLMWWDVSDPDAPVLVAQGSTRGQCGSIAASEDGSRVYVNTINGVIWTDLSTWVTGDLTFAADPLLTTDAGLSLRGDRLIARSGENIHVFDESARSELGSFTVAGANAAALTDAGIFVEADGSVSGGTENGIGLYDLSGNTLQTKSMSKLAYARDITSQRAVASGKYAIDTLTHRLFAVGGAGFDEIEQPQVGAMSWAFAAGETLHTRSNLAAHRIDVSDPTTPAILAGGPTRDPVLGIKLDTSLTPASLVPETDPSPSFFSGPDPASVSVNPSLGHATQTLVESVSADGDEHYVAADSFQLPGGQATLLSAGDFVYRAPNTATDTLHFQRWRVSDLKTGRTTPLMDLGFEPAAAASGATSAHFDVDAGARVAVLARTWTEGTSVVGKLHWLDLSTEPASEVETISGNAVGVRVHGERLVFAENTTLGTKLHFRQRGSDAEPTLEVSGRITRLLGFDGTTVYYAVQNALRAVSNRPPAAPVSTLDLATRGTASSLAATSHALVATTSTELLTFAPVCD